MIGRFLNCSLYSMRLRCRNDHPVLQEKQKKRRKEKKNTPHQIPSTVLSRTGPCSVSERTNKMILEAATPPDGFQWSLKTQCSSSPLCRGSLPLLSVPHWLDTSQGDESLITRKKNTQLDSFQAISIFL